MTRTILDAQGKQIFSTVITGTTYELNKGDITPGIYFLKFEYGSKTTTQKLIVQ